MALQAGFCNTVTESVFGKKDQVAMTWDDISTKLAAEVKTSKTNLGDMGGWRSQFMTNDKDESLWTYPDPPAEDTTGGDGDNTGTDDKKGETGTDDKKGETGGDTGGDQKNS